MSDNTVFGKPIEGTINESNKNVVEQADPSVLEDAIDRVFEYPQIEAFKWEQYTPYFNDGEPCEFNVNGYSLAIKFYDVTPVTDFYDDGYYRVDEGLVDYEYVRNVGRTNQRLTEEVSFTIPEEDRESLIEAITNLSTQLDNGTHEIFLRRTFGDHAEITTTREGFNVEFYDHE